MGMGYAVVIYALLACIPSNVAAQEQAAAVPRTVQLDGIPTDAPVKIVRVMLNGAAVEPGVSFQAGDDWFNQIRAVIKNTSRKNLVYAAGQLRFPETGDATAEHLSVMDRISVGRRPEHAGSSAGTNRRNAVGLQAHVDNAEILVRPGEEIAVPVVDPFDSVKAAIEARQRLSSVTICEIGINQLYFDDGTSWLSGLYFRADPSMPGKYVRITQKEFETNEGESR